MNQKPLEEQIAEVEAAIAASGKLFHEQWEAGPMTSQSYKDAAQARTDRNLPLILRLHHLKGRLRTQKIAVRGVLRKHGVELS